MKIKIYKNCLEDTHTLYMNDKQYDYIIADRTATAYDAKRFKFKVFDMISDWDKEMVNEDYADGLEYIIIIKKEDKEIKYHFKNKFPRDIIRLQTLIEEVLKAVTYDKN